MTHAELIEIGARWLSKGINIDHHWHPAHGVVVKELVSRSSIEVIPDVIGFASESTTVIECKVSRQDYKAELKKRHRNHIKQMGNWRYYLTPAGLLQPCEIYDGWGLLEADGKVIIVKVPAPWHNEPEIRTAEYHVMFSVARRKLDNLVKYIHIEKQSSFTGKEVE